MENKKNTPKLLAAGVLAALAASLCCITPVLTLIAGISGAASAFSWLDPFRPFFIGLTILALGFAWHKKLQTKKEVHSCACDDEPDRKSFAQSKKFLALVTILAVLLLAFPYSQSFFPEEHSAKQGRVIEKADLYKARLDIKGMTCAGCERSVNHVLKSRTGVVEAEANYENGLVQLSYDSALTSPEILKAVIEDELGYQVTHMETEVNKED
jgi:mercuric ion transport protein